MNKYIRVTRRKESGILQKLSNHFAKIHRKFKKHDHSLPENLSEHEIHIEEKKPNFFKRLLKGKSKQEQETIEEEVVSKPEAVQEKMEEVVEDYDTLNEVEKEVEHKKDGLFSKFKSMLKSKPKHAADEDIPVEQIERVIEGKPAKHSDDPHELREDLKRISKITLSVIHDLDEEKQDAFKRSGEFHEYKTILEKHGLVK